MQQTELSGDFNQSKSIDETAIEDKKDKAVKTTQQKPVKQDVYDAAGSAFTSGILFWVFLLLIFLGVLIAPIIFVNTPSTLARELYKFNATNGMHEYNNLLKLVIGVGCVAFINGIVSYFVYRKK